MCEKNPANLKRRRYGRIPHFARANARKVDVNEKCNAGRAKGACILSRINNIEQQVLHPELHIKKETQATKPCEYTRVRVVPEGHTRRRMSTVIQTRL